jgi:hypothetical protein
VSVEQVTGQPVLPGQLNQEQLARHGVPAKVVADIIESIGGKRLGDVIEGQLRFRWWPCRKTSGMGPRRLGRSWCRRIRRAVAAFATGGNQNDRRAATITREWGSGGLW